MNTVIVWTAQYLLWAMVVGFVAVWLLVEDRRGKVEFAVATLVGLVLAGALLYIAKSVHHDPRPFVQNPAITPLFSHGRDDGFPSDHSIAAGLIAGLVLLRHRLLGLVFVGVAVVIAWARVAAHVHHLQDVAAGLFLGGFAAVVAYVLVARVIAPRLPTLRDDTPALRR